MNKTELPYVGDTLEEAEAKLTIKTFIESDADIKATRWAHLPALVQYAYKLGAVAGKRIQEANNQYVQDAVQEQHEKDSMGIVRAAVVATMEAFFKRLNRQGEPGTILAEIDLPLDQMTTVYERFDVQSEPITENGVTVGVSYKLIAK